ncbi:formamidopyrimidine-DNA glycosylase [Legionella geestiana]|uniref:Formamidopyrimidine-DNA glycosylase n=1 Tax=Legionella geestiana TaxID=45065 RepID=A0A0W0TNV7_9GAMM|nr:bifunctional DNA-formamidopyrimidine glycosylase/DNA-(apurinic or apyrimidinic site) lyase [Legionella geestiana]KTC97244.1 formamidopyrimidine-DNA glycosylase [Legionella geestiana]QBS12376.1 bifunctional DNA-formamidopyrimidine glycosylase/DNA-(apurinic or apyrimidinic site) lyase [Legionella geestiana]QDQ39911.1 bifunctional DNA-formamidopyrimidine glycosylase/DNA-(apurinic or apyrimidinic site) lyase [Legionella geestiana]STX55185.1 formamidopyrimidine-DNA glycosylase [Legionella geestia
MPELPEVETVLRGIRPHLLKSRIESLIVRDARLRWPVPPELADLVQGQRVRALSRRGKYLLVTLETGTLLIHLGMSGRLHIVPRETPPLRHDHVDMRFSDTHLLRFTDPRRFGAWLYTTAPPELHPLLQALGPEPLEEGFNAAFLHRLTRKRVRSVKTLIMDSHVVVGVGNIYAQEALFLAGIHPEKPAGKLSLAECECLVRTIREVLQAAIDVGGTTLKDFTSSEGRPGYFSQSLHVYGRAGQPCTRCGAALELQRLAARSTVYCPCCQVL